MAVCSNFEPEKIFLQQNLGIIDIGLRLSKIQKMNFFQVEKLCPPLGAFLKIGPYLSCGLPGITAGNIRNLRNYQHFYLLQAVVR